MQISQNTHTRIIERGRFYENFEFAQYVYLGYIIFMLNTLSIFEDLSRYLDPKASQKIAEVLGQVYEEVVQAVTKIEFNELKEIVGDLARAQKNTEKRLEELTQAQSRTEKRLEELAQAQSRTEKRLEELAQAQKELAKAQSRTEKRLEELAQAQEKTERSLSRLIEDHHQTRERLESMSDAVGYNLENQSYKGLPPLLKRDLGIEIEDHLIRRYLPTEEKGRYLQVNIYGWGKKNGKKTLILGEAKTSISRREISRFQKLVKKAAQLENIPSNYICPVIVVHDVTPSIEEYAKEQGIHLYWSYDL
jgi:DNA repair exonuclease SbcCD ATPase subunit